MSPAARPRMPHASRSLAPSRATAAFFCLDLWLVFFLKKRKEKNKQKTDRRQVAESRRPRPWAPATLGSHREVWGPGPWPVTTSLSY